MPIKGLKRFRLQDIEPGMVLGKTVLDEYGRVILEQGKVILQENTVLTRDLLDRLRNWNIQAVDIQVLLPTQAEKAATSERKSGEMSELLDCLNCRESLSVLLDNLAQLLGRIYPSDNAFVSLLAGEPARWWSLAGVGSFRLPDCAAEQKFKGQEYLAGQAVLIQDLSLQKAPPGLARADISSMCGVPVLVDGLTVGVIEVFSRNSAAFAANDLERLSLFARQAGMAASCAKMREELRQVKEERK